MIEVLLPFFLLTSPAIIIISFLLLSLIKLKFENIQFGLFNQGKFYHWAWNNFRFIRKIDWYRRGY